MRLKNISHKIALSAAVLGIFVGLVFGITSIIFSIDDDIDLAKDNTKRIINTALPQVSDAYWQVDVAEVNSIFLALLEDELIFELILADPLAGNNAASETDDIILLVGAPYTGKPKFIQKIIQADAEMHEEWEFQLLSPRDGVGIGTLTVGINLNPIYARIVNRSTWVLLSSVLQTLLVSGLIFLMAQYVVIKPVQRLISMVEGIRGAKQPNLSQINSFAVLHKDEIGQLAHSFEGMVVELDEHQKNLETLVDTRTKELVFARNQALEASDAKTQFLANISHELRTPLNAILGLSDLLVNERVGARKRRFATDIRSAANQLSQDIDAVLDFSKIEADKIELEQIAFALDDVIDDVIYQTRALLAHSEVVLTYSCQPDLPYDFIGDPNRIRQILLNLTSNAAKFTPKGEIEITVSSNNPDANIVTLDFLVTDTGIGLSVDQLKTIFTSFSQADSSTSREFGGTGLGLTIAKRLANIMGGELTAKSILKTGSQFRLSVPLSVAAPANPSTVSKKLALILGPPSVVLSSIQSMCERSQINVHRKTDFQNINISDMQKDTVIIASLETLDQLNVNEGLKNLIDANLAGLLLLLRTDEDPPPFVAELPYPVDIMILPVAMRELASAFDRLMHASSNGLIFHNQSMQTIGTLKGKRILLAEDNILNQTVVIEHLEQIGADVYCVRNGQEAVEEAPIIAPDLILMDIQMPVMDGFEATQELGKIMGASMPPIIALTANASSEERQRCIDAGMQDFLSKPVVPALLRNTAVKWTSNKQMTFPLHHNIHKATAPSKDLININLGLVYADGNHHVFLRNLQRFKRSEISLIEKLRHLIAEQEFETLKAELHKVKGALGIIGAERLKDAMRALARRIDVNASSKMPEFESFIVIFEETLSRVDDILIDAPAPPKSERHEDITTLMAMLRLKTDSHQLDAINHIDSLQEYEASREYGPEISRLIKALEAVDFRLATKIIATIENQL